MQIGDFKFSIIELKFEPVEQDYRFYGSYYRGMLGRNLKRRFCVLRDMECESCPLADKCLYMLSFEKYKDVLFPPYIINREGRDHLRVSVVGNFCDFAEIYLQSFEWGLKVKESGFFNPITEALTHQKSIFNSTDLLKIPYNRKKLNLKLSYARFKKDSKMIDCGRLSVEDILKSIEKRIYLINKYYGDKEKKVFLPECDIKGEIEECRYFDVKRYSNRKKRTMKIPSINVNFSLEGDIEPLYPYIYLAGFLNIGTNASMGFGQVKLYADTF